MRQSEAIRSGNLRQSEEAIKRQSEAAIKRGNQKRQSEAIRSSNQEAMNETHLLDEGWTVPQMVAART